LPSSRRPPIRPVLARPAVPTSEHDGLESGQRPRERGEVRLELSVALERLYALLELGMLEVVSG
jgi:hypothetical protein